MRLRILGLDPEPFRSLFALGDGQLAEHLARRVVADEKPGYPCRVSLEDAEPGETLVLVNYEHLPERTPYRASHAIYVREAAREKYDSEEVPEAMHRRILSLRAFDASGMLVAADLATGNEIAPLARSLLALPGVAVVHAHHAKQGCFAARIERAPM
jgi:hypothetical protein